MLTHYLTTVLASEDIDIPTTSPVSLAEIKRWIGIADDETSFDLLLEDLIATAARTVELYTDSTLISGSRTESFPAFDDPIALPFGPASAVTSITYYDTNDSQQTVSPSVYALDTISNPQLVVLNSGQSWPQVGSRVNPVQITYTAGFANIPPPLKTAIRIIAAALFEDRTADVPDAAVTALYPYRSILV